MGPVQFDLLEPATTLPEGFVYRPALISPAEESDLTARFTALPFREFEFHGYLGKRRTVSFGLHYDFGDMKVHESAPIPEFLWPLRAKAAAFAGVAEAALQHALVTEYAPGAPIGWHRDRPVFGDVIGISFASSCRFRFRRPLPNPPPLAGEGRVGANRGGRWDRVAILLERRSAYLLRGPARSEWEHSIPPAEQLRYSLTFRTVRAP